MRSSLKRAGLACNQSVAAVRSSGGTTCILPDSSRIYCMRCGANNFPGQPKCFQCGASLPPPESLGVGAPQTVPTPQQYFAQPAAPIPVHRTRLGMVIAVIATAILMAGSLYAMHLRNTGPAASQSGIRSEMDELDRLRRDAGAPAQAAPEQPAGANNTERELDRLRQKYGINDPGSSGSSGGSAGAITFDQYQHGQRVAPAYEFH